MMRYIYFIALLIYIPIFTVFAGVPADPSAGQLRFVPNQNQWEKQVIYKADLNGGQLYLEKDRLTFNFISSDDWQEVGAHGHRHEANDDHEGDHEKILRSHSYQMVFRNASPAAQVAARDELQGYYNYYLGNDPQKWASSVKAFGMTEYRELYKGISVKLYQSGANLKYDVHVKPFADPAQFQVEYKYVEGLELRDGNLVVTTSVNTVTELKPVAWQIINGEKVDVPCHYKLTGNVLSFDLPYGYNQAHELIIDPTLIFSTFTGSTANNWGYTATPGPNNDLYAGGITLGFGYPVTTGAFQTSYAGGSGPFQWDITISKFNSTGSTLLYSTYLGGSGNEAPHSLIVNNNDELYVYGTTGSSNYPVTTGCYDNTFNGGTLATHANVQYTAGSDIIVTKFNSTGTALLGSTFIGGTSNDGLNGAFGLKYSYGDHARGEIILDNNSDVYIASSTNSSNFPVTTGAAQSTIGGSQDAIVFKLSSNLTSLIWSTYLGGTGNDGGFSLKLNDNNEIYVAGGTSSNNFPVTTGVYQSTFQGGNVDGFLSRINNTGTTLMNSTYIGTSAFDQNFFVEVDSSYYPYVYGLTQGNFPIKNAGYSVNNAGQYIAKLPKTLDSLMFSTRFGKGDGNPDLSPTAFMVDVCGNIFASGWSGSTLPVEGINPETNSFNLPTTTGAYMTTTNGSELYFIVLSPNAGVLKYATYFGSLGTGGWGGEHVDGGTSRFDKNGVVYHAVCGSCGMPSNFPVTPGVWSTTNAASPGGCNLAAFKFAFDQTVEAAALVSTISNPVGNPSAWGCAPLTVNFDNNSTPGANYFWHFGDGDTSTTTNPSHIYTSAGVYQVMLIATDSTTCNIVDTAFTTITVKDDTLQASITKTTTGICDSITASFTYTGLFGQQFLWDFGDGDTSSAQNPVHTYYSPGTYVVTLIAIDSNTCNITDTLYDTVKLLPKVMANSLPYYSGCTPQAIIFPNNSVNGQTYFWDFGDGTTATLKTPLKIFNVSGVFNIMMVATNPNTCNISDTAFTTVVVKHDSVVADFTMVETGGCDSLMVQFTNTSSSGTSFSWSFGDGDTSTQENPFHTYYLNDTFQIQLIVYDSLACDPWDTAYASVSMQPRVTAACSDSFSGCANELILFDNNSINATTYLWHFGNGTTSTSPTPSINYNADGTFNVMLIASNPNTCNGSDTFYTVANLNPLPVANFTYDPSLEILIDNNINFTDSSSADAVIFSWSFGDGTSSQQQHPQHVYTEKGVYQVCEVVENNFGCIDTLCKMLEVTELGIFFIPNAFSPNGDGYNDIFMPYLEGVETLEFRIFNRWGEELFFTTDPTKGWDGKYNGVPQPVSTYIYHCKALLGNGERINARGNVTLVR